MDEREKEHELSRWWWVWWCALCCVVQIAIAGCVGVGAITLCTSSTNKQQRRTNEQQSVSNQQSADWVVVVVVWVRFGTSGVVFQQTQQKEENPSWTFAGKSANFVPFSSVFRVPNRDGGGRQRHQGRFLPVSGSVVAIFRVPNLLAAKKWMTEGRIRRRDFFPSLCNTASIFFFCLPLHC